MHSISARAPQPSTSTIAAAPAPAAPAPQERQVNNNEAPKTEAAPQKEEADLSPKFAALAKKEQWLRKLQREIEDDRSKLKQRDEEYSKNYVPRSRIKEDPFSVLQEEGLSYDHLTNLMLSSGQGSAENQEIRELKAKIAALETSTKKTQDSIEERDKRSYEQAVNQVRADVGATVEGNPDFEMIRETKSQEAVVELIKETFEKEGKILAIDEAARQIEDYLLEESVRVASLSKVKQKLAPPVDPEPAPTQTVQPKQQQHSQQKQTTLTNAGTASPSLALSRKDRRARAILAAQGKL